MSVRLLTLSSLAFAAAGAGKIKHVVLLMEENRSFDHMCGFFPGVNGLKGNETNPYNTSDPNSPVVTVSRDSPYVGPYDPDHGLPATTEKIFGARGLKENATAARMDGFVETEARSGHSPAGSVMQMFTPDRLPVLYNLSREFAIFDRFFCSVPGPTWPNRLFQLMGTSQGNTATGHPNHHTGLYFGRTIFDQIEDVGLDWRFYFADVPLEMAMLAKVVANPEKVKPMDQFRKDARAGTLPAFSWMNPRWFVDPATFEGANDQHPDHDVRLGDALLKEVYEELRNGPEWNSTLFIVTYDEHGGFYDHVSPPMDVPAPDEWKSYPDKFDFKRGGVRVPALLISPWVKKGTVISAAGGPDPTSEYELTSVLSTMKNLFGFERFLTKRDAWAAPFDEHLSEASPRTDCPKAAPPAPKSLGPEHARAEAAQPLNDLQKDIVRQLAAVRGAAPLTLAANVPMLQGQGAAWAADVVKDILAGKHALRSEDSR
ncbi:Non-specific phospholipase C2 [Diplonema papillatum]|nr:Non-specific phospholipase C2 [Diplonema papillatum]